eukprot:1345663-Rhodomonas_salina.1
MSSSLIRCISILISSSTISRSTLDDDKSIAFCRNCIELFRAGACRELTLKVELSVPTGCPPRRLKIAAICSGFPQFDGLYPCCGPLKYLSGSLSLSPLNGIGSGSEFRGRLLCHWLEAKSGRDAAFILLPLERGLPGAPRSAAAP